MRKWLLAAVAAAGLGGCAVQPPGQIPIATVQGPVPMRASSPMSEALTCLATKLPEDRDLRLAVFTIPDRSGVADYDGPGAYLTQGAELMMVSALAKTGVRQVNRTATNVAEWELNQAIEKRLGEGAPVLVADRAVPYRPVPMGSLLGSTHTVYGGLTELDFDILSDGAEVSIAGFGVKGRGYYISVGMDLVVSDSRTTEIVLARHYRKQIWGQELEAGLFRFWDIGSGGAKIGQFGVELFDVRVGKQQNEPVHASVRWIVEQAAYELVRDLAGVGDVCEPLVPGPSRTEPTLIAQASTRTSNGLPPASPNSGASGAPAADTPFAAQEPPGPRAVRLPGGRVLPVQNP